MPGFVSSISNSNEAVFANNADFSGNTDPSEVNGLRTNGQLWIGSTAVNAGNTHVNVGNITSTGGTIAVTYATPNINIESVGGGGGSTVYFSAYLSAPTGNVTGDGTLYGPIVFDTALSNVGGGFNTGTGVFTAPSTGLYSFQHTVSFNGGDALTSSFITVWNGSAYGSRSFQLTPVAVAPNTIILSASIFIPMTAGDTLGIQALSGGTNKNIIIYGSTPTGLSVASLFSGFKIP